MKIVSLLPSATEIVFALGLGDALEGVTDECDHPPQARGKPVVSSTALSLDGEHSAGQIDAEVGSRIAAGESIYRLDRDRIADIGPDLILTQDLCRVCAVPTADVFDALATLGCRAQVVSLDPATLEEVIECIAVVGDATGTGAEARLLTEQLRARVEAVRAAVADRPRLRTFALEWSDPPFSAGHWVPDMIRAAGGEPVLADPAAPSRRLTWEEVAHETPEVVTFMPCGYRLDKAVAEGAGLLDRVELSSARRVFAVNADAFFSRPGPRLVDGVEALAWALHPEAVPAPPAGVVAALRK